MAKQNTDSGIRCPFEHFSLISWWRWVFPGNRIRGFFFPFFFCMNPGCAVGLCQALTADDHYFQTPPAEQFFSLSSTRTALLLNNARWRKTLEARCSDAQLCIHEEPIAAAAILFIRPLSVCSCFTHLAGYLCTWAGSSFPSVCSSVFTVNHGAFLFFESFSLSFAPVCQFFAQEEAGSHLHLCGWRSTSVRVCAASWRWRPSVRCFISHFSATPPSSGNALISRDPAALFVQSGQYAITLSCFE